MEEVIETKDIIYNEYEEEFAYAKLQGPNLLKFVKKKTAFLGRESPIVYFQCDEEVIFISDSNKISRKHLKIYWCGKEAQWFAKNLSKNPVIINRKTLKQTEDAVIISPVSAIKIDNSEFYFIQAVEE